jgi:hypothetical protein
MNFYLHFCQSVFTFSKIKRGVMPSYGMKERIMLKYFYGFALALASLYGATASAVADTQTLTCSPVSGLGPTYLIANTSGGAPGYPVAYLSVTRKLAGYADVSASIDLLADKNKKFNRQVGPFQDGSALVYTGTFSALDDSGRELVNTGYISVYVRASVGLSWLDVQLPADVENAAALNTNPPLSGYSCSVSLR